MPKAYDYDLRRKVIEAIERKGIKCSEASQAFGVSRNTIHHWFLLKSETRDLKPRPIGQARPKQKITDWEQFQTFVVENTDKTQAELAELWPDDISTRTISRALKHIGFKSFFLLITGTQME